MLYLIPFTTPPLPPANKAGARHLFNLLAERARDRLRTAAGDDDQLDRALSSVDLIAQAERYLESNVNLALVMDNLAAQLPRARAGVMSIPL